MCVCELLWVSGRGLPAPARGARAVRVSQDKRAGRVEGSHGIEWIGHRVIIIVNVVVPIGSSTSIFQTSSHVKRYTLHSFKSGNILIG